MLHKERFVVEAAHPRHDESVQPFTGPPFQLVCNIVSDPAKKPSVDAAYRLNLILSHGTGFSKEVWDLMVQQMYNEFGEVLGTVVVWDWANHNESYDLNKDQLGWTSAWSDGGRDIVKIAKHLKENGRLEGTTVLIGHSMGATQSLFATLYEPSTLFDSVIAFDPVLYSVLHHTSGDKTKLVAAAKRRYAKLDALPDTFANEQEYERYMTKTGFYRDFDARILAPFKKAVKRANADGTVSMGTPNWQQVTCYYSGFSVFEKSEKILAMLDHEVLHVAGDVHQGFTPVEGTKWVRDRIKHVTPVDIPGGRHTFPFELPDATFEAIKPFISRRYARAVRKMDAMLDRSRIPLQDRENYVKNAYAEWSGQFPNLKILSKL